MKFADLLDCKTIALTEGAVIERVRRSYPGLLDPELLNAPLIYHPDGRAVLTDLHRQYLDIGRRYDLPMLVFTDTWRAGSERLKRAGMTDRNVNADCVLFVRTILEEYGEYAGKVFVGGLIGCRGDAYRPEEALSEEEAASFHAEQIERLADAGAGFLCAATIPSITEARGMAAAMSRTGTPYIISFILNRGGQLLDGTPLHAAVASIDGAVDPAPAFYMANCCHPTFYETALKGFSRDDARLLRRVIGLQANTSSRDAGELDNLPHLDSEEPAAFAASMMALHRDFGTRILGGCCGTDDRHIAAIARDYAKDQ